jgi:hypothetical protein
MISLRCSRDNKLSVIISKSEKINLKKAKKTIRTGKRMIRQNQIKTVTVEIKNYSWIDKSALEFFNRILSRSHDSPAIMMDL